MASISENIELNLTYLGITGVEAFQLAPDRIWAWDLDDELITHIKEHPEHWMTDRLDPLHGSSMRANYREKAIPSMQCVEHAISQVNHPNVPCPTFWEIDFDEECPDNPITITEHLGVCVIHAIRHSKTDQTEIFKGLLKRYELESV